MRDDDPSRLWALAAQTTHHHIVNCLKYMNLAYELVPRWQDVHPVNMSFSQVSPQYYNLQMLNGSLLKANHVLEAFQAFLHKEISETREAGITSPV